MKWCRRQAPQLTWQAPDFLKHSGFTRGVRIRGRIRKGDPTSRSKSRDPVAWPLAVVRNGQNLHLAGGLAVNN